MDSLKRHLLISLISVEQPIGNLCIIIQIFLFPNNIFINIIGFEKIYYYFDIEELNPLPTK
jgi:hypothetical protein